MKISLSLSLTENRWFVNVFSIDYFNDDLVRCPARIT